MLVHPGVEARHEREIARGGMVVLALRRRVAHEDVPAVGQHTHRVLGRCAPAPPGDDEGCAGLRDLRAVLDHVARRGVPDLDHPSVRLDHPAECLSRTRDPGPDVGVDDQPGVEGRRERPQQHPVVVGRVLQVPAVGRELRLRHDVHAQARLLLHRGHACHTGETTGEHHLTGRRVEAVVVARVERGVGEELTLMARQRSDERLDLLGRLSTLEELLDQVREPRRPEAERHVVPGHRLAGI